MLFALSRPEREKINCSHKFSQCNLISIDTQHEAVLAKNRRDWVFSERDKIVRERESIRTLCDKLRRERDSAVSQFMGAVKDYDEIKRSECEALRQLKEYK